jgi:hypothetical protein
VATVAGQGSSALRDRARRGGSLIPSSFASSGSVSAACCYLVDGFEFEAVGSLMPAASARTPARRQKRLEAVSVSSFASAHLTWIIRSFERFDKRAQRGLSTMLAAACPPAGAASE